MATKKQINKAMSTGKKIKIKRTTDKVTFYVMQNEYGIETVTMDSWNISSDHGDVVHTFELELPKLPKNATPPAIKLVPVKA